MRQKMARNQGFVAPPAMHLLCMCSMTLNQCWSQVSFPICKYSPRTKMFFALSMEFAASSERRAGDREREREGEREKNMDIFLAWGCRDLKFGDGQREEAKARSIERERERARHVCVWLEMRRTESLRSMLCNRFRLQVGGFDPLRWQKS